MISAIRSMGMEPIQWDVDSLDWKDYDADTICQRVTSKLSPGSIVLFHNAALHTPEALPAILDHMAREGVFPAAHQPADLSGELYHRPRRAAVLSGPERAVKFLPVFQEIG